LIADDAFLARRLAWLTALRLTLLSLLLAVVAALYLKERALVGAFSTQVVLVTVGVAFALAAAFAAVLRVRRWLVPLAYVQLVFDQIAWTVLAYVTGGVASPAATFYGITCVLGAVVAGVSGAVVTAVAAAGLLIGLGVALSTGTLPAPRDHLGVYPVSFHDVSYHLALNLLALVVVAVLAGYLAERLRRTGGQLVVAEQRAEEAERLAMLGRFSAGLAHEIRNPLGSIAGSIELLATGGSLSDEDKVLCDIISREASRLNDLVTDMLDLAKPRAPERQPVDVAVLASEVVQLASRSGRGMDVRVKREGPERGVVVDADAGQLRQILWNLVRNAVQASGAGARVTVRVLEEPDRSVVIEVQDEGPGIASAAQEKLFDAFFTTRTHGVGIGLAVVKRIVDDHGFRIEALDAPTKGAIFRVTVPPPPAP
jgi:signal transduction histidine kinase